MAKREKNSFILFYEWEDSIRSLTDEQAGQLLRALFAYEKRGEQYTGGDPAVELAMGFLYASLDRNREKYEETCRKRSAAGKKGGAPKGNQNARKDENKQNNCVDNLEWCSAKYNMNYGVAAKTRHAKIDYSKPVFAENARLNGAKVSKPVLQFSKDGTFVAQFESGKQAHLKTKINHSHIMECCSEKRKTAGGYVWKYEERNDDLSESQS